MKKLAAALLVLTLISLAYAENWPNWRGPNGLGISVEKGIPAKWDPEKNIKWKVEVPGLGHSSPIVWGDRIFVTTAVNSDPKEATWQKGLPFNSKRDASDVAWKVMCFDKNNGKLLWEQTAITRVPVNQRQMKNSYASQSPVTDGTYVYAFFGDQGMYCYDFNGKLIWKNDLGSFTMRMGWGTASSPVLYKNYVIQTCDQETGKSFIIALDKKTGKTVWKTEREELSSWSTPYLYDKGARPELIVNATKAVRSYDPETGMLLWECRGPATTITVPVPTSYNGLIITASGYVAEQPRPLTAIRPGASGDITLKQGETKSDAIVWRQSMAAPYIPSPVAYEGRIYVLFDQGFLACYDANTGREIFGRSRIGSGVNFSASPLAMDGMLFCGSEDGDVFVFKAGDQFELLAKNSLGESIMASPAVSDGRMFIRTIGHLFCIQ
jgi:outer membrane protein assembly factor BamB